MFQRLPQERSNRALRHRLGTEIAAQAIPNPRRYLPIKYCRHAILARPTVIRHIP
jgi:hypothetical protein